jgi:pyrroline-5-carboxylate reductase
MATALALGWTKSGLVDIARCRAADPDSHARARYEKATGIRALESNRAVVAECETVVLAVKPQVLPKVLEELRPVVTGSHLIISIAAGVTIESLAGGLGDSCRIVRVMPNTPCLVGASASAYSPGKTATTDDIDLVGRLFGAVGKAVRVAEPLLDAVTGLSGSGPAYAYVFIEALADGGVKSGLPRDVAMSLAAQTLLGAAKMVIETGQHPGVLKDAVASPGGTTIAGLHALERAAFRAAVMNAVEAAAIRARELGKKE